MFILLFFILFSSVSSVAYAEDGNLPEMEIRISDLEEQLRDMYGKVEELEYKYRELEKKSQIASNGSNKIIDDNPYDPYNKPKTLAPSTPMAMVPIKNTPIKNEKIADISTPEKHYQVAFDYLSKRDFTKARNMFQGFLNKYPNDNLTGNAYYWIGETYYVERDYSNATKMFKAGYEQMPNGLKASDNLLKLALSLENLGQPKKACVIYGKLMSDNPPSFIASRVRKELASCN